MPDGGSREKTGGVAFDLRSATPSSRHTGVSLRNRTKLDPRPYPLSRILLPKTGTDTTPARCGGLLIISLGSRLESLFRPNGVQSHVYEHMCDYTDS
jgi:hypothetical protein